MKKLLYYIKDYKKESILGPLFKLLEASFELFIPLIVANIIDFGIKNSDKNYILKQCIVLVILGVVGLICSITAQYFAAKASVGFVKQLRNTLFNHIQSLSFSELDTIGISTLITRMTSDMNQVQSGVNLTLRLLLRSPFIVLGAIIMAFTIDAKASLVFIIAIPLLALIVFSIMFICIPLYKKVQVRLDKVLSITRENLTGVRVIRAFCKEKEEITSFKKENSKLTNTQKQVGRISALMNPLTYIIVNIAIIALIWIGAIRVNLGILTQGAIIALYNYISQILVELIKLANLIININKSVACGDRIQSILEIHSSIEDGDFSYINAKTYNMVEFNKVSLTYENDSKPSLEDINFSVKKGETIGIIGGTGSGKTSLINLIPRFYQATKGCLLINGVNVNEYSLSSLRNIIGIVPQKSVLFKGSIRANMQWGKDDASDDEIFEALSIAQGNEIVSKKEGGLDYLIEQGGKNLSGGQRQRLTIARALIKKPEILILDDSSSALDFATDFALRQRIKDLDYNPTVFIVSQRTSSIEYADKIIVLDNGRTVGIGTHEELLSTCEVYKEIYYSQFKKGEAKND